MELEISDIETSEVLADKRAIQFVCLDGSNNKHTITIKFTAVTPFLTGLSSHPLGAGGQPDSAFVHPLHPRGARAFRLHNGETGLAWVIAERVEIAMAFPKAAIPQIRKQLDMLEKL